MKENSDSLDLGDHEARLEGVSGGNASGLKLGEGVVKVLPDVGVGVLTGVDESFSRRFW